MRRGLFSAHLLYVTKNEHHAEGNGKLIHCAFEQTPHLGPGCRRFRVAVLAGRWQIDHTDLSLIVDGINVLQANHGALPSEPAQRLVQRNARQPS